VTAVLAAQGVACAYGDREALAAFDLAAAPGTVTALLGANGAGKSTALRALARLHKPRHGAILLDGQDVWRLRRRAFVRRVAFLPQTETAPWPMTVEQMVLLGRLPHRGWLLPYTQADRAALARALDQVELQGLGGRDLGSLSGGERRRVLLARALAQDAAVLVLDEPGAHLDLRHQVELFDLLRRLAHQGGTTVVLSLHDLHLAALFADHAVLLRQGRVLAQGPAAEVLSPDLVRAALGVTVEAVPHPRHGVPLIVPVTRREADR